jgi:hypothetical protein
MKTPALLAALLATALAAAGATSVVVLQANAPAPAAREEHAHHHEAGADVAAMHGGTAGDDPHAQLGMQRPRFPPAQGSVPTAQQAESLEEVRFIQIESDAGFADAEGVSGGDGTLENPYRISGLHVTGDLYIADTSACVEITGNWIERQLVLNWNGQCVWVHHNFIRDLRVNENVERTGLDTGGLIELNQINYVGQIRHYDGEFRNNVIGPRQDASLPEGIFHDLENLIPFAKDTRILNIDGWNQALFHHNTVHGSVDLKLHGHHHGTGFLASHSHYHGDGKAPTEHEEDHTDRWSAVSFTDNRIIDPAGYGLRYVDEMHSGDDQTARSESHMDLEKPHQHHTLVDISRNALEGSGIWVDILNADDRLHKLRNPAWLTIAGNSITMAQRDDGLLGTQFFGPWYEPNTAIWIWSTKEAHIQVTGNTMAFKGSGAADPLAPLAPLTGPATQWFSPDRTPKAISIEQGSDESITIAGNRGTGFEYGVKARDLDEDVRWAVYGNTWQGVTHELAYDDSVANEPSEEPLPPAPDPYEDAPDEPTKEDEHEH